MTEGGFNLIHKLSADLAHAFRNLNRDRAITTISILCLALAIGLNTSVFSWMDALLFRKLPVHNPEELVQLAEVHPDVTYLSFSRVEYEQYRDQNQVLSGLVSSFQRTVNSDPETVPIKAEAVSTNYFQVLGVRPAFGRLIDNSDDKGFATDTVAVLSYEFWRRRFNADPSVLGTTLRLNGISVTVIGVAPQGFGGVNLDQPGDIFVTLSGMAQIEPGGRSREVRGAVLTILGRLRTGITRETAIANLQAIFSANSHDGGGTAAQGVRITLLPASAGWSYFRDRIAEPLTLVMASVAFLLVVACANLSNVMLVRVMTRRKETAVRLALGLSRWRLIWQLVLESLLLSAAGTVLGLILLRWSKDLLCMLVPASEASLAVTSSMNIRVLWFAVAMTMLTGLLCSVLPGLRATQVPILEALQQGSGRSSSFRSRLGESLIVVQVAMSLALLVPAALCIHSLRNLAHVDVGFDKEHVLLLSIAPGGGENRGPGLIGLYEVLQQRLEQVRGVNSVSFSLSEGFQAGLPTTIRIPGFTPKSAKDVGIYSDAVSSGYFQTMGIPVLLGRDFGHESANGPRIAIINKAMSDFYFPGQEPIGKRIVAQRGEITDSLEVVGVVANARYGTLRGEMARMMYIPVSQAPVFMVRPYSVEVRTSSNTSEIARRLWSEVHAVDSSITILRITRMAQLVKDSIARERLLGVVVTSFGIFALLLTCLGIYGVMSYNVSCSTREIGIRMALGAQKTEIARMVEARSLVLVAGGIAAGSLLAFFSTRAFSSYFFDLSTASIVPVLISLVGIMFAGVFGTYWPAVRASRVEILRALERD